MLASDSDDEFLRNVDLEAPTRPGLRNRVGRGRIVVAPVYPDGLTSGSGSDEGPPRRRRRIDPPAESPVSHRTRNRTPVPGFVVRPIPCTVVLPRMQHRDEHSSSSSPSPPRAGPGRSNAVQIAPPPPAPPVQPPQTSGTAPRSSSQTTATTSSSSSLGGFIYLSRDDSDSEEDDNSFLSFASHSNSVIDIGSDSDLDSSQDLLFEEYDIATLSDVEVVRESGDESDSGSSGPNGSDGDGSASETDGPEGPNVDWLRQSHVRRNAIVDEEQDPAVAAPGTSTVDLNAVRAAAQPNNPNSAIDLPPPAVNTSEATVSVPAERLNESVRSDDEEGMTCLICYESFTNSGEHRLCCLKCGHTYGKVCIEKWIKAESRCPQCNSKASKKDIRIIYVKNLKALDTAERDSVLAELGREQELKRKLELECARLRQMNQHKDAEYKVVQDELMQLKGRFGNLYRDTSTSSSQQPSTSAAAYADAAVRAASGNFQFSRVKVFDVPGEARVGAYNEWLNMLVVSQNVKSPLYPQGMFGIKRFNLLDMKATLQTPIHQKEIRDLQFCPSQSDILLSVGMDKKGILTNVNTNVSVQTFNSEYPLWSCAWSTMSQHIFYAGTSNGMLLAYDLRNPRELLNSYTISTTDKAPVAGIRFVPPSYQQSNSFTSYGLLLQKLNSVWFCELTNEEPKFHQLPVYGGFQSMDFEPKSRHVLFSTRHPTNPTSHMVGELTQYYSDAQEANVCSCNIVQTFNGDGAGLGKMCRSSIFSPIEGKVLVAANGPPGTASIWDVSNPTWKQSVPVAHGGGVLDFVPSCVNNSYYLNTISSQGVGVYGLN